MTTYEIVGLNEQLQEGDEVWVYETGEWVFTTPSNMAKATYGGYADVIGPVRRKSAPTHPKMYWKLRVGDLILDGDEFFHDGEWHTTQIAGQQVVLDEVYRRPA